MSFQRDKVSLESAGENEEKNKGESQCGPKILN